MEIWEKLFGTTNDSVSDEINRLWRELDRLDTEMCQLATNYEARCQEVIIETEGQMSAATQRLHQDFEAIKSVEQSPEGTIADLTLATSATESELGVLSEAAQEELNRLYAETRSEADRILREANKVHAQLTTLLVS